ncbi:MAG: glutaredoxin family protein [Proteobacteria bacterium]|nr:glutaredoxin family protein [Pseudomonadota bacterium]
MNKGLVLYGTSACHLCEVAQQMLEYHHRNAGELDYSLADISESEELFQNYGLRIPVLQRADGTELDWPFSIEELRVFLA